MKSSHKKSTGAIVIITVLLVLVTIMDTLMVFNMTREQTKESGAYQLLSISGKLEGTINDAEKRTMQIAVTAQELLEDKQTLESFIYNTKKELLNEGKGALNIYIAGPGWDIIPDFADRSPDFVATERTWYKGARRKRGGTNVTPPYVDVVTGQICYTISVMLADNETVLGVDYTMDPIREHIMQMYENGSREAAIVTGEGIIAGCSDDMLVRQSLNDAIPKYAGIFALAKKSDGVVTSRIKSGLFYENLFATGSGSGWYLIVSESDWMLYRKSYLQLFMTLILSIMLFAVIIALYSYTMRSRQRAEDALASKEAFLNGISGELKSPLKKIMDISTVTDTGDLEDYHAAMAGIHEAGEKLSDMIGQILSYSSIVHNEKGKKHEEKHELKGRMSARFRGLIVCVMVLVMALSLYANIRATYNWGKAQLKNEVREYEDQLTQWVNTQKSILDMFASTISTNPEMLNDYDGTIAYLDRIKNQYPEISVVYLANPELNPTVYMNNGWYGGSNWHVEERQWYIDTLNSESGWSISSPYYDEQTGLYCITISERVYNYETGRFMGIFAIDFYMDKLVDILGSSYSEKSFAFLVDPAGGIINHPYGSYQMTVDNTTNVSSLPYGELNPDGESTKLFKEYDNSLRLVIAHRNSESRFTVYVVSTIWSIFGRVFINGGICLIAFLVCTVMVYRLLTDLIAWQEEANERLKEAADKAIAAGRAKGQFLAQMSHEIRTPINAVLGMNEMILRECPDEKILDYSENIRSAGRTLLSLINSILDFSKIEDGKMEIIAVKYDTASMINNLVNSIQERARNAGLEFNVIVDDTLPSMLYGDDMRVSQVIMNLLTNAVKYTEKGSVSLSLHTVETDGNDVEILVEVKDTGIGIKKEDMGKLFASFERIEEKRNRNIEGTGLGMSIVTRLLEMMDSELMVDSEYGVGSKFSFVIKQGIADATPIGDYTQRLLAARKKKEEKKQLKMPWAKVLVVDDNAMNIKVAINFLNLYAIKADTADSGAEAIKLCAGRQYDMIFLDHMMPQMDGIETLEKLKEQKLLPEQTRVIALTANAVIGAKESYLEAGFDDYLSKPIEIEQLEEKLIKYLPEHGEETEDAKAENASDSVKTGGYHLIEFDDDDDEETAPDAAELVAEFKKLGLSTEDGLRYCAGSEEFYLEVLRDFMEAGEEKRSNIGSLYGEESWKDYETAVHALKSSAKTIGAMELSEEARDMENAAKTVDIEYIHDNHEKLMKDYAALLERMQGVMDGKKA